MEAVVVETAWYEVVYTALSFALFVLFHLLFFWAIVRGMKRRREQRNSLDP